MTVATAPVPPPTEPWDASPEPVCIAGESAARMSEAEYFQLPDARVEFVDGEARFMSPVSLPHARLVIWLNMYVGLLARTTGAGEIFPETFTVRLSPRRSRAPDLTFIAKTGPAIVRDNCIDGPPNLIIEVVSPDSRERDYRDKYLDYQAAGVAEYWIIDPTYQTIDLHRLAAGAYVRVAPDASGTLASEVLPGLKLRADWLRLPTLPNPVDPFAG